MSKRKLLGALTLTLACTQLAACGFETTSYASGGGSLNIGAPISKAMIGGGWLKCPSKKQNANFFLEGRSLYRYNAYTGRHEAIKEVHGESNCFYKK